MNKALLWLGGTLLAILSALFVVPHLVDWNNYRGEFEEEASRVLGREVRVGGRVVLRLLPAPYVQFEKIRISDNAGTLGEPFFRADGFTMGLSVLPLLKGVIEARHVELLRPVLTLAIDAEGRGNWRDVKLKPGAIPFIPAEISLQAVEIVDGALSMRSGEGELIRLEPINGDLSAENLEGPYKFRGVVGWNGESRDVRLSTARQDPDGSIRFKSVVKVGAAGSTYTLDGKVADIVQRPRISGELSARIPYLPASSGEKSKGASDKLALDLRAQVLGDSAGAALADINLSFDQDGQPQLVTGEALATWRDGTKLKLTLASRWLDLDKQAGAAPGAGPIAAIRALVPVLVGALPGGGQTEGQFTVDQVALGGESIGDLSVRFERGRGPMQLREFKASLPGGAKLELGGTLVVGSKEPPGFDGNVSVQGGSFVRFYNWAAKGLATVEPKYDAPFGLQGRLVLSAAGIDVLQSTAHYLGPPLAGAVSYRWEGRPQLAVQLEGPQIDVAPFMAGRLDPEAARQLIWPVGDPAQPSRLGLFDPKTIDMHLRLRTAEMSDGERILRDVDADITFEAGAVTLGTFKVSTPAGVRVEIEGDIAEAGQKPQGVLRGLIAAGGVDAVQALLNALDRPGEREGRPTVADTKGLEALVPMRLAGSLAIGGQGSNPAAISLNVDGVVRGARTTGSVRLDGGLRNWRQSPLDVSATTDNPDAALALVAALDRGASQKRESGIPATVQGRLAIKALGTPASGLMAVAALRSSELAADFDGKVMLQSSGTREFDGNIRFNAPRMQQVLALLGLPQSPGLRELAMLGEAEIVGKGGTLRFRPRGLKLGNGEVAGYMSLSPGDDGRQRIEAVINVPRASFAGLLTPVLGRRTPTAAAASGTLWPDDPFDLSLLDRLEGRITLRTAALTLDDGLTLNDALIEADISPARFAIPALQARMLGGVLKTSFMLTKAPAGAELKGSIKLEGGKLEELAGSRSAVGPASFELELAGRALTPHSLVAALQGKGQVEIGAARVLRHSPSVVPAAIDAALNGPTEPAGDAVRRLLLENLPKSGPVSIGPRTVGVQMADGALKVQRIPLETETGRGSLDIALELSSFKVDGEWRLEPKGPPKPPANVPPGPSAKKGPLPGVSIVYVGPVKALAGLEPRLSSDALEREIVVRKIERDTEELERLRREDEARAKIEAERQERLRQMEIDRASSAATGASSAPVRPELSGPGAGGPAGTTGTLPAPAVATPAPVPPPAPAGTPVQTEVTPPSPVEQKRRPTRSGMNENSKPAFNPFNNP